MNGRMTPPPFLAPLHALALGVADQLKAGMAQAAARGLPPLPNVSVPDWLSDELKNKLILTLNHVLMQEPQAMQRLARHKGKGLKLVWGAWGLHVRTTPAGLLAIDTATEVMPDLTLTVQEPNPVAVVQAVAAGDKPPVDIQGDVQLAAEVAWLVDNVRWDAEEDLAYRLGDGPAHVLVTNVKKALAVFKNQVQKAAP